MSESSSQISNTPLTSQIDVPAPTLTSPTLSSFSNGINGGAGVGGVERVFPIRSVLYPQKRTNSIKSSVSASTPITASTPSIPVTPSPTATPGDTTPTTGAPNQRPTFDRKASAFSSTPTDDDGTRSTIKSGYGSTTGTGLPFGAANSERGGASGAGKSNQPQTFFTQRFEHSVKEDGANWVVTGREGVLLRCEDEPIHAPGAIQAFGVLIAFDRLPTGEFKVQQVSENSSFILGIPPVTLFKTQSLTDFLNEDESDVLEEALEQLDERDEDSGNTDTGSFNFQLSGFGIPGSGDAGLGSSSRAEWRAYCAVHRPDRIKFPNRAILELELMDDLLNPLTTESELPSTQEEKGGMESCGILQPTEDDLLLSTVSLVKPLRALARLKVKRARGGSATSTEMDVVALLSQINEQMAKADDLQSFLKITAGVLKELTEFDRVMVYQFDEEWNGRVVAEQVDWSRTKDLFRGLNFPASDIPAQARELYKINKVRCLYDRDQPTARMCCRSAEEVESPLDMTHCHLRAMSPIHTKYLGNMGVRSSMSISITAFGTLWGLVAMHCYGRFGHRVSFPVRQLSKLLGESISKNIERLSYAKRLHSRKLINTQPTNANPSGYIVAKAEDLLTLFDADFGCLSIGDEAKILGTLDNSQELLVVLEYLRVQCFTSMHATQDIRTDFPDIDYPVGFELISGFLTVPLSAEGKDFIVFFRRSQLEEIRWAGNPYTNKKTSFGGETFQPLEPRKSFASWSETVVGKCRAWTDEQRETAGVLCLVYGKFIDVWRQKETALAANQLTNLLLANASHEVRTPLNAIVNYLELALEGKVDDDVRENLTRSHAASRTLIHVINDLLDLTRAEKGNDLFLQDPFDLPGTIKDAVSIHKEEALRRGLTLEIIESPQGTPPTVLGDRGKVKNIVANVVANAVKHTTTGGILVEWGELVDATVDDAIDAKKDSMRIGISITDTGSGMSDAKLETIFREFEQVTTVGDASRPAEDSIKPSVGLGLAVVARIVRNLGGQLRVESKEGQGSKFTFVLPFVIPSIDPDPTVSASLQQPGGGQSSYTTLSSHGAHSTRDNLRRRANSSGSVESARSGKSITSGKSDIASLISAMSSSHMDPNQTGKPSARHNNHFPNINSIRAGKIQIGPDSLNGENGEDELEDNNIPIRPIKMDTLGSGGTRRNSPVPSSTKRPIVSFVDLDRSPSRSPTPTKKDPSTPDSSSSPSVVSLAPPPFAFAPTDLLPPHDITAPGSVTFLIPPPPEEELLGAKSPIKSILGMMSADAIIPRHMSEIRRSTSVTTEASLTRLQPMRVLVVEDEPINRMIVQKRLQKDGHVVVLAEHGGDAIRLYQADPEFDVILMDLQMPIVNGFEAADAIRAVEANDGSPISTRRLTTTLNGRIPILAVSASLHERQRSSIADVGIDGWILKPIDFKRLNSLMRGLINPMTRREDVYQPGRWEKGGWLTVGPEIPITLDAAKQD